MITNKNKEQQILYSSIILHEIISIVFLMLSIVEIEAQTIQMVVHHENEITSFQAEDIDSITFSTVPINYDIEYKNLIISNPFPLGMDSLKLLILGNSFSYDATNCLQTMLDSTLIEQEKIGIYNYSLPAAGFHTWIDIYREGKTISPTNIIGKKEMISSGLLSDILRQSWDMVLLLNTSSISYKWSSFTQSLPILMNIVKSHCTNKQLKIGYFLPWGHTKKSTPSELVGNIWCARQAVKKYGIDLIIPIGVAIENARNSYLQKAHLHNSVSVLT